MSVMDGSCLKGELLSLSCCKLVRTDAITLTVDTRPSITLTRSAHVLQIQMVATESAGVCALSFSLANNTLEQKHFPNRNKSFERSPSILPFREASCTMERSPVHHRGHTEKNKTKNHARSTPTDTLEPLINPTFCLDCGKKQDN